MRYLALPRFWSRLLPLLLLIGLAAAAAAQASVTISSDTVIATGDATYDNKRVTVQNCTVTIDGLHRFYSLNVAGSGVVTHSAGLVGGLQLNVDENLTVGSAARIDVSGKGYGVGEGPGHGNGNVGSGGGAGASYAGEGGSGSEGNSTVSNNPYGVIAEPTDLGSGGGTGYSGTAPGGAGGGFMRLIVGDTLNVTGRILANGAVADSNGGGGSGGSIVLHIGAFSGSGLVNAGGAGTGYRGGAGGGGRIAIYYTTALFTGIVATPGGNSNSAWAGAGTIFRQGPDIPSGELTIDNADHSGLGTPVVNVTPLSRIVVDHFGKITPIGRDPLSLTVTDTLKVGPTGWIIASGRGFGPGDGPGRGVPNLISGGGGGASYGGIGGYGWEGTSPAAGVPYGSITEPTEKGSGGAFGYAGSSPAGSGGGAVRLIVKSLFNDGHIEANGTVSDSNGGAGSGGSIWIDADAISGAGIVSAAGGGTGYRGGAGGGGRIAIHYGAYTYSGSITAPGGNSLSGWAGAGTVVLKASNEPVGRLYIDNAGNAGFGTPLKGAQTFDGLVVSGRGVLVPTFGETLTLLVTGDCTVDGGVINATGFGFGAKQGPGAGISNAGNGGGGGGGYGSVGKPGSEGTSPLGGGTYGSQMLPTDFGSGGGDGFNGSSPGGLGGGAIRLLVNGTLLVNGRIEANGTAVDSNGGSGSGGSILLRVGLLTGTGTITTDGGSTGYRGGGGGGGRIALYYVSNSYTGILRAAGGNGISGSAASGTVYTERTTSNLTVALAVSPTSLGSGQTAAGSVTLSDVAPVGGLTLVLTSANPAVAVPPTVFIPEGSNAAAFTLTASAVTLATTGSVSARLYDQISGVSVTVLPWLASLRANPDSVVASTTVQGIVTLALPAPDGGLTVALQSSDPLVGVPGEVVLPAGTTSKAFPITVGAVVTPRTVTLKATYLGETLLTQVQANPAGTEVASLIVTPASVVGGNQATAVLQLTQPAPAGGVIVSLASSDRATITMPASARILPGRTNVAFTLATKAVTTVKSVVLSATLGTQKTSTVIVRNTGIAALDLFPDLIVGGDLSIGVVTLDSVSRAPVTVTVTSDTSGVVPEAQIVIPAGQTTGYFLISSSATTATKTALISAKANSTQKSRLLTITP